MPMPSPSVSAHSVGSVGNASGPASQTPATAVGPSQTPSSSVSGSSGSVAGSEDASSVSSSPSPSSSWSSKSGGSDVDGPSSSSGIPSPSVSVVADLSSGKASEWSGTPSMSESRGESQKPPV